MEIRLNKLMSDFGLCSRREADKFIEMGRVTVNGKQPEIGQKVTEKDIVLVDGEQIRMGKHSKAGTIRAASPKVENLILGPKESRPKRGSVSRSAHTASSQSAQASVNEENKRSRREHYGKYNKYAAARRAAKERESQGGKPQLDPKLVFQEATQPKFGKSLSRSAVAQRMAASPKSAALRKTSRNNPINKAKRIARRKNEQNR